MSKEESTIIKGVAILLMLFLHLFNKANIAESCHPIIFIGDLPFVHILSRAANPVDFYIILSGYGLGYTYQKGRLTTQSQAKRLLKLYIYYWLILFFFVSLGSFIRPNVYPGNLWKIIGNFTNWNCSYNYETWFLFPYAVISLTACIIFKIIDKLGYFRSLLLFYFITIISQYFTSRYIAVYKLYDSILAHLLTYLGFLFCFTIGYLMFRTASKAKLRIKILERHPLWAISLLLLLIALKCTIRIPGIHEIYVFLFIMLFLHIPLNRYFKKFLIKMGEHSMPIWMIHSFFCYYLFHDFIYGFDYPILIYTALLCISYIVSIPIMRIASYIIKLARL